MRLLRVALAVLVTVAVVGPLAATRFDDVRAQGAVTVVPNARYSTGNNAAVVQGGQPADVAAKLQADGLTVQVIWFLSATTWRFYLPATPGVSTLTSLPSPASVYLTLVVPDQRAINDLVRFIIDSWNKKDAGGFISGWTNAALAQLFEVPVAEIEMAKQQLNDFIGSDVIAIRSLSTPVVSGSSATAQLLLDNGGTLELDNLTFTKINDVWYIGAIQITSPPIPSDYKTVSLQTVEFAFRFDATAVSRGKVAFAVQNAGTQDHEAVLLKIPANANLQQILQQSSEDQGPPPGVDFYGQVSVHPGDRFNMVLTKDLVAGRYAMVCFFPDVNDPQHTPHALKGMVTDFTIP
jgi:hypothetical protein